MMMRLSEKATLGAIIGVLIFWIVSVLASCAVTVLVIWALVKFITQH